MNDFKILQNCVLKKEQYQVVQIAVAVNIIRETPPHLTPAEFARNLQEVICQKINEESEPNDHDVNKEAEITQNTEAVSEIVTCLESSQTKSIKKNYLESKSWDKKISQVKMPNLKSKRNIIKESEAYSTGTLKNKLLHTSSSETQKMFETETDVFNMQENDSTLGPANKTASEKKTKKSKVGSDMVVASKCQIQFNCQNQTMGGLLPCKEGNSGILKPVDKNITNIYGGNGRILQPGPDQSELPDSASFVSPLNLIMSTVRHVQPNPLFRTTRDNYSLYTVPTCSELPEVHRDNESGKIPLCKNVQILHSKRESSASVPNDFYIQWHQESERDLLKFQYPELQLSQLLNKTPFAESLIDGNPANPDNWIIRSEHVPHEEYERPSQNCKDMNFSPRNCEELLKAVMQETEDVLRDAQLGIYPCWNASQNFIKIMTKWLHQETLEGEAKYMCTEFIIKMLTILCQCNPLVNVEQISVSTTIWWTILRNVRSHLVCLCTTPGLWQLSGNILVSALISISHKACSQMASGYSVAVVDHMAEIAQTVAEILKKVIGYACSLLTVKPKDDWNKSVEPGNSSTVNCSYEESSCHQHPAKHADAELNLKKMANTSQTWKTRIQSALNSLAIENSFDIQFQNCNSHCKCLSYVNSTVLCTCDSHSSFSHSTNLNTSAAHGDTLQNAVLTESLNVKCILFKWGYLLQTECLPVIKSSLEMLHFQVTEITDLVISALDVK